MTEDVRVYIERVKAALSVTTDEQLATKLGYSKQAIASWRSRRAVPYKAELRIVGILGEEFSLREPVLGTRKLKWEDTIHGLAIFAIGEYTSHWQRPFSYPQIRAIGRRFDEVEDELRRLFLAYSAAAYPQNELLEIVVRIIEKRLDQRIDELLSVFEGESFLEIEAGLGS